MYINEGIKKIYNKYIILLNNEKRSKREIILFIIIKIWGCYIKVNNLGIER